MGDVLLRARRSALSSGISSRSTVTAFSRRDREGALSLSWASASRGEPVGAAAAPSEGGCRAMVLAKAALSRRSEVNGARRIHARLPKLRSVLEE